MSRTFFFFKEIWAGHSLLGGLPMLFTALMNGNIFSQFNPSVDFTKISDLDEASREG